MLGYYITCIVGKKKTIFIRYSLFCVLRLIFELKIWMSIASEVECLEIRTSSCYFRDAGVSDVVAAIEVE